MIQTTYARIFIAIYLSDRICLSIDGRDRIVKLANDLIRLHLL
ncbi:hypothetical protein [Trichocoleus sp. Lan]